MSVDALVPKVRRVRFPWGAPTVRRFFVARSGLQHGTISAAGDTNILAVFDTSRRASMRRQPAYGCPRSQ
jgi:hypothetical protein